MNDYLNFAGLAKKAGHLKIGEEALASMRAKKARLIIIAADAADNSKRRAEHAASSAGAPVALIPATKSELGSVLGKADCAMAAVTDTGIAAAMLFKLRQEYPSGYEKQELLLQNRLQRERERKKEAVKNVKGKKTARR